MHVHLGVGGQIKCASRRLHIEHELELLLAMLQPQPTIDLLALVQIDGALEFATIVIGVVFQTVLARDFALFQREPSATPTLRNEYETNQKEIHIKHTHIKCNTACIRYRMLSYTCSLNENIWS